MGTFGTVWGGSNWPFRCLDFLGAAVKKWMKIDRMLHVIPYMSRSSDLKECFLRSQQSNHKIRLTPPIFHINKIQCEKLSQMWRWVRWELALPLWPKSVPLAGWSSCYNSHFIIIFRHQQSRSKHTLSVSLIPQPAPNRATPTFSATQHILTYRMQTFRLALLTFDDKKIEVGALFPKSYFLRQIPKEKQVCQLSYRVTLKVTEGLDWHNSEVTFEEVMQQSSSICVSFRFPTRKWDLHFKRAWQTSGHLELC